MQLERLISSKFTVLSFFHCDVIFADLLKNQGPGAPASEATVVVQGISEEEVEELKRQQEEEVIQKKRTPLYCTLEKMDIIMT